MDLPAVPYDLRWRFAVHEAGHAIVHHILKLGPIHGINIDTANGGYSQLGFTASGSDTLGYLEDMLAMLMAGRAAEQIVVGSVSSGSGGSDDSDLARATKLALSMERTLGFAALHPLLYRHGKDQAYILDGNPDLAARVHARLETALAKALEILQQNRGARDALIEKLFQAQSISGKDFIKTIRNYPIINIIL